MRGELRELAPGEYQVELVNQNRLYGKDKVWFRLRQGSDAGTVPEKEAKRCFWCEQRVLQHDEGPHPWFGRGPGHTAPREWAGFGRAVVISSDASL